MNSLINGRDRTHTNPIFNDNKMKLGVFGFNASNGCAITMAPERHIPDWDRDLRSTTRPSTNPGSIWPEASLWRSGTGAPPSTTPCAATS